MIIHVELSKWHATVPLRPLVCRALLPYSSEPASPMTIPSDVLTATEHIVKHADGLFLYATQILTLLGRRSVVRC